MSSPSWYQLLTIAAALADVASVMIGGTLGLAVRHGAVRRGEAWTTSHNPARGFTAPGAAAHMIQSHGPAA